MSCDNHVTVHVGLHHLYRDACGFYFVFSHKLHIDPAAAQVLCFRSFVGMVNVRDIYGDVRENFVDPIPIPRLPLLPRRQDRPQKEQVVEDLPLLTLGNKGYENSEGETRTCQSKHSSAQFDRPRCMQFCEWKQQQSGKPQY